MINGLFDTYLYCAVNELKYYPFSLYNELSLVHRLVKEHVRTDPEGIYTLLNMWSSFAIGCILRDKEDKPDVLNTISEDLGDLRDTDLYDHLVSEI